MKPLNLTENEIRLIVHDLDYIMHYEWITHSTYDVDDPYSYINFCQEYHPNKFAIVQKLRESL